MRGHVKFVAIPPFEIDDYLLLHVVNVILCINDLCLDLAQLLIGVAVASLQVFHLTKMSQLFLINYHLMASCAFIIEPVIFPSCICSMLFILLLRKSLLHSVHLLLCCIDLNSQGFDQVLLLLHLFFILQDGSLKALALIGLSLVLNKGSLFVDRCSLLSSFLLFSSCTIRGWGVLLLIIIL